MPDAIPLPALHDVERHIGSRIAALRSERGLTQEQIAAVAGVTKGYMSKIENGRSVPPIGTLLKIAHALNTEISEFLKPAADAYEDIMSIVRIDERQPAVRGASAFGYDYVSLAHKKRNKRMEPFLFSFPTEMETGAYFEHEGEEFIFVLSGRVEWEMIVDGNPRTWVLDAGDSLYFESRVSHRGRGLSEDAKALIVIYTPS